MKLLSVFGLILFQFSLFSQEVQFKVELSTDSILLGSYMEVRFTIENAGGDFDAPGFEGFDILSGPNTSSSFSMINGNVTQKASYSYVIRPVKEGILYIDPGSFTTEDKVLETEPIQIMVYPNPGGIQENKPFQDDSGQMDHFFQIPTPKEKKVKKFEHKKRKI